MGTDSVLDWYAPVLAFTEVYENTTLMVLLY